MNVIAEAYRMRPDIENVRAMSLRGVIESEIVGNITSAVIDQQSTRSNMSRTIMRARADGNVGVYYEALDSDVDNINTFAGAIAGLDNIDDGMLLEEVVAHADEPIAEEDLPYMAEFTKTIAKSNITTLNDFFPELMEMSAVDVRNIYEIATDTATDTGVTAGEVFENDRLYARVVQSAYTPDEFVAGFIERSQIMAPEKMLDFVIKNMVEMIVIGAGMQAMIDGDPLDVDERTEIANIIDKELIISGFVEEISPNIAKVGEACSRAAIDRINKWWGPGAILKLSPATVANLESL